MQPLRSKPMQFKHPKEDKIYTCQINPTYRLVQAINDSFPTLATRFAVNIGAGDGCSCNDPVYPLFLAGYGGLAVEADTNLELAKNLPSEKIRKIIGVPVSPLNAGYLLQSSYCPSNFDYLKIDIDGYDGIILKAILEEGLLPKVIQMEVNPEFPPPFEFSVLYDTRYLPQDSDGNYGGFYGASMSFCVKLARQYGYRLVSIDFVTPFTHDIILVQEQFFNISQELMGQNLIGKSLRDIYLDHPPGYSHFAEYGIDAFAWRYRTDFYSLLTEIWSACMAANFKKHCHVGVPFLLSF
jgi:hypothetical protein